MEGQKKKEIRTWNRGEEIKRLSDKEQMIPFTLKASSC